MHPLPRHGAGSGAEDEDLLAAAYMAISEASKKWTMPIRHWKAALNHFAILFENRLPKQPSK